MFYTYVLFCKDLKSNRRIFYIGSSSDLKKRLKSHFSKSSQYTKSFDRISLVYYEACLNKTDAIRREIQLKTGFGRGYIKRRLESYLKTATVIQK
ncbi:MAG: GIY-YIG nuclease family protein [Patescibacteria group bacterium]|nr:GIY-YIG nuclease family protein [Patescibacteria group bacterium]